MDDLKMLISIISRAIPYHCVPIPANTYHTGLWSGLAFWIKKDNSYQWLTFRFSDSHKPTHQQDNSLQHIKNLEKYKFVKTA